MKTKIFTLLILGTMFLKGPLAHAQNLLYDGDFSTTTEIIPFNTEFPPLNVWCTWMNTVNGVNAYASVINGVCSYQVYNSGINSWDVQLNQWGTQFTQGHAYRLTFDVKADVNRSFGIFIGEDGGNWTDFNAGNHTQFASTDWQTIRIEFNVPVVFALHKLSFELGTVNTSMYFDNISLEDLGTYTPTIGIIGDAINGWDTDVDLITTDGINYSLSDLTLTTGGVKFRQDNFWMLNWGSTDFPAGIGYQDGPNIPVSQYGNYNITFNRVTGEYSFTCVNNCAPQIGIIGTAVPPFYNWETDLNMLTKDGLNYYLHNQQFVDGAAKFRQDHSWDINWSNSSFPSGTGVQNGNEISVKAGVYNVNFNRVTGEYGFTFQNIGVLGSALNGWTDDIDLQTSDGILYTLENQYFNDGLIKFRAENDWSVNWGASDFPVGWAYIYGPDIPVQSGTYNLSFNTLTGEYKFTATSCPSPALICPNTIYKESSPVDCGAIVNYPEIIPAYNCGGNNLIITQIEGMPSGSLFPVGYTWNTYKLTNTDGNVATCSFGVSIYNSQQLVITGLDKNPPPLWPPNHKMVNVPLNYEVAGSCGSIMSWIYIFSNEPEYGLWPGDKGPDWEIVDEHNIKLRAERWAKGPGREYYIYVYIYDESWNFAYDYTIIKVPHDKGKLTSEVSGNVDLESNNMNDIGKPFSMKVWPNPSNNDFNLQAESLSNQLIEISVFDISNKTLKELKVSNNELINIGCDLMPGIYLIKAVQGNYIETVRVVKH